MSLLSEMSTERVSSLMATIGTGLTRDRQDAAAARSRKNLSEVNELETFLSFLVARLVDTDGAH